MYPLISTHMPITHMDKPTCTQASVYMHTHISELEIQFTEVSGSYSSITYRCYIVHAEKLSTQEAGAGGSEVQSHSEVQKDF